MGELATMEGVRLPTMTEIVARMEAQGWVTREMAADDRRCVDVRLTDAGRRLADQVIATRTTLIRERLDHLSEDEKASLAAALPAIDRLLHGFAS
jgi:DNA-binding MarR family transcriptional regulator